jgi:dihydrofolate synthase/folylpolyglutamate synthase
VQEAGYKTGLYTSPHLKSFTERIRVNGKEVSEDFVIGFVNRMKRVLDRVKPSFFETTVAMAFDYFAQQKVDVAVVEVGLGGRLDSTNVITPVVSLITNIGYDHTDMLGDTLEKIAFEKAGIIKPGVPVVISERQKETTNIFLTKARECNARIHFAQDDVSIIKTNTVYQVSGGGKARISDINLPLAGNYQAKNLCGVVKVIDVLNAVGFTITDHQLKGGIENVLVNTGLKGRWQILGKQPLIICDTAHNAEGLREVVGQLAEQNYKNLYVVLGMVKEKQHDTIMRLFPQSAYYFFCQANIPRALDANELALKAKEFGLFGTVEPDVNHAIAKAKALAGPDDLIFIGGSTFVVAEINDL